MDAQMKRGFLEVCVLASINRQDSYGYQIVKDVPAILNLTESTLYPLLKRLEAAGLLTTYSCRAQRAAAQVLPHHWRRACAISTSSCASGTTSSPSTIT